MASKIYLSIDELARCRDTYDTHIDDYVATVFQLRIICSEFGQYPPDEELVTCLRLCGGRLNFNMFCRYALYLKYIFNQQVQAVEEYEETTRAFAALGGSENDTILGSFLLETCQRFALRTDILAVLVADLDADNSGTISLDEFKELWRSMTTENQNGFRSELAAQVPTAALNFHNMTAIEKGLQGFLIPKISSDERTQEQRVSSLLPVMKRTIAMSAKRNMSSVAARAITTPKVITSPPHTARRKASPKAVSPRLLATLTPRPPSTRPKQDAASYLRSTYKPVNLPPIKPKKPKKKNQMKAKVLERKLEAMRSSQQRYKQMHPLRGFLIHDEDQHS